MLQRFIIQFPLSYYEMVADGRLKTKEHFKLLAFDTFEDPLSHTLRSLVKWRQESFSCARGYVARACAPE